MPEFVVGVRRGGDATVLLEAAAMLEDIAGERQDDQGEADAAAETLVALRDEIGSPDTIVYHVCQHDQGQGDCTALTVEL